MANTYIAIATVTVGSGGASSIQFTGLGSYSSLYKDLLVVASTRTNYSSYFDFVQISFNSGSSFSSKALYGTGGGGGASQTYTVMLGSTNGDTATSNSFSTSAYYIPNYSNSTNKSVNIDSVGENNSSSVFTWQAAGLWSNTAAITSITLSPYNGTSFKQYSTAYLYGISST